MLVAFTYRCWQATLGLLLAGLVLVRGGVGWALTIDDVSTTAEYEVRQITVAGEHEGVSASAIRDVMLTKIPPWYKPWQRWTQDISFNPEVFRTDLERVRTFLRESGYYEATVAYDLEVEDDEVTIQLQIESGRAATVRNVTLAFDDFAAEEGERRRLEALIRIAPGDVFRQSDYDGSRERLLRDFRERGYAYVDVQKSAVVDTTDESAVVSYRVTRGAAAVFGSTTISGLGSLDEILVRRELTYLPGASYDPRELEKTQARIFALDLFRSVTVKAANIDARSGVVDVQVGVEEGPPRRLKIGVGYGLEDGPRGQIRWELNNFFGGGRRMLVEAKGSQITQSLNSEFRQPYFLDPQQTLIISAVQERVDVPGYELARARLVPRVERRLSSATTISFGYNIEYDDLLGVPEAAVARLDEFKPRGFVSSLLGSLEHNTTDNLLDPHAGSVLRLEAEQAGSYLQGDYTFYRAVFEAKHYVPLFTDHVLAGRFRIGAGDGFGGSRDLPVFRRFYAGGINSTRGYDRDLLGPLTADQDPIGGRSLIEGNLEYRFPIYDKIGGVVFVDAGSVDLQPFHYDLGDLQLGVGPGVRYDTLVGPLRLDIGFPLNPPSGLSAWQIHFSVGQAF